MKYASFLFLVFTAFSRVSGQTASFTYQYHNDQIKQGKFSFVDPAGDLSFESTASAGYLVGADNPYYQSTKDVGPIPNGTWEIYAVANGDIYTFRLRPTGDVVTSERTGFLIHGIGKDKTIETTSKGCIIIPDRALRKKLFDAFNKYGAIRLKVTNIVTSDGVQS